LRQIFEPSLAGGVIQIPEDVAVANQRFGAEGDVHGPASGLE
jgi:hypothetical protein